MSLHGSRYAIGDDPGDTYPQTHPNISLPDDPEDYEPVSDQTQGDKHLTIPEISDEALDKYLGFDVATPASRVKARIIEHTSTETHTPRYKPHASTLRALGIAILPTVTKSED